MPFCPNCGKKISGRAKFCSHCGSPADDNDIDTGREEVFEGKVKKCPNCGEVLKAFEINCPACGFELREAKASGAVKEFALKLEAIESNREYEKPQKGLFANNNAYLRVSKTDAQIISLIKSFAVPNTKEDMLEFMILATSSINMSAYDSWQPTTQSDREKNNAWFSKAQQVYEKAKRSYSKDGTFVEIKQLYDECNRNIKRSKKKGVLKYTLLFGWLPILAIVLFLTIHFYGPISEKKEVARLEAIVDEIEVQLEAGEYKYALMNADGLVYKGTQKNEEQERQWKIKREYWIDKVIEEAEKNGVTLERPKETEEENVETNTERPQTPKTPGGAFIKGFKKGLSGNKEE